MPPASPNQGNTLAALAPHKPNYTKQATVTEAKGGFTISCRNKDNYDQEFHVAASYEQMVNVLKEYFDNEWI